MYKEIKDWILNPSQQTAIKVADWYFELGQYASAIVYYLKATEFEDNLDTYYSLLRIAIGLNRQGDRYFYAKGLILHAIDLYPNRQEAYNLMSKTCEYTKDWQESYTFANLGLQLNRFTPDELEGVEYYGDDSLIFQRAVAGWWMNRVKQSWDDFVYLHNNSTLPDDYKVAIKNNLKLILK